MTFSFDYPNDNVPFLNESNAFSPDINCGVPPTEDQPVPHPINEITEFPFHNIIQKSPHIPSANGKIEESGTQSFNSAGPSLIGKSGGEDALVIFEKQKDDAQTWRGIFSDPISGDLMRESFILPCGHSFGNAGLDHAVKLLKCFTCSQPVSPQSITPNLTLQTAIAAFCRKRKRYIDNYEDSPKGYQFPLDIMERVIIKGNKRTPPRFIGREAVVTKQCLNGWYVVQTMDGDSVKLQYRSLAKMCY